MFAKILALVILYVIRKLFNILTKRMFLFSVFSSQVYSQDIQYINFFYYAFLLVRHFEHDFMFIYHLYTGATALIHHVLYIYIYII